MGGRKLKETSKVEDKILLLLNNNLMSISELSKQLSLNRQYVKGVLESLEDRDYVKEKIIGRSKVYIPI